MARVAPERRREQERDADGYLPIEHHGVIGDLHTVALVGNEGTIDWFCPERFDAPSLFGSILDAESGGRFSIQPVGEAFTTKQLYLPGHRRARHALLHRGRRRRDHRLHAAPGDGSCSIVRRIEVVRGSVRFRLSCLPAFDYARAPHRLAVDGQLATFLAGDKMCELRSPSIELEAAEDARRRRADARARRAGLVRALAGQARARLGRGGGRGARSSTRSRSGAGGSARAPIAGAGARWSIARRSRSSCSRTCRRAPSSRLRRPACPSTSAGRATGTTATAGCATRRSRCSRSCAWASARRRSPT